MTPKPLICLIGCGLTGQVLLEYLEDNWQLIIVEKNPDIVKKLLHKYKNRDIKFIEGDASSALILQQAEVERAYQVIVTINDDVIVKEVITILQQRFETTHITAKVSDRKIANSLRKKNVNVVIPAEDIASLIINQLELGESFALHVGKGVGEIMQIQLTNNSPLLGIPLKDLPPKPWIIGAIYRPKSRFKLMMNLPYLQKSHIAQTDQFILPKGDTKVQAGDKLLLIGDPQILKATAHYLKAGEPSFPKRHGDHIISLFLNNAKDSELQQRTWLFEKMQPCKTLFIYHKQTGEQQYDQFKLPDHWVNQGFNKGQGYPIKPTSIPKFLATLTLSKRIGLVIYQQPSQWVKKQLHNLFLLPRLIKVLRHCDSPLWIIRYQNQIKKINLFVSAEEGIMRTAELAMDTALKLQLPLQIIQILAPKIIAGAERHRREQSILTSVKDLAALYGLNIEESVLEGNPLYESLNLMKKSELLVIAIPKKGSEGLFIPNVTKRLLRKFPGSLLILPT